MGHEFTLKFNLLLLSICYCKKLICRNFYPNEKEIWYSNEKTFRLQNYSKELWSHIESKFWSE